MKPECRIFGSKQALKTAKKNVEKYLKPVLQYISTVHKTGSTEHMFRSLVAVGTKKGNLWLLRAESLEPSRSIPFAYSRCTSVQSITSFKAYTTCTGEASGRSSSASAGSSWPPWTPTAACPCLGQCCHK